MLRNYSIFLLFLLPLTSCQFNSEKKENYTASTGEAVNALQDELTLSMQRGQLIYEDFCVTCHQPDGMGVENSFPPLAGSNYLLEKREESIRSVKYGQQEEIIVNGIVYNGVMAPMGLEDDEVADVMNYILNSWGNSDRKRVSPEEVSKIEK